ncbi:hypothetical protein GCM10010182_00940 [Actinomadura cremea]|nr:hypothetical protein GCM10010182_00940 [Actinomadura cremea]
MGESLGLPDALSIGLILALQNWLIWMFCWGCQIQITPLGVVVPNAFRVHRIPWQAIEEIEVNQGLVIKIFDQKSRKKVVQSIHYGSSTLGGFTGYPTHQEAARRLKEVRTYRQNASPEMPAMDYQNGIEIPWRSFIVAIVAGETVALAIVFLGAII